MPKNNNKTLVVLCEHASCHIPEEFNNLGLCAKTAENLGYDPGAAELAEQIAGHFSAQLFKGATSRLLIDLNRIPSDADSIPALRDNTVIPGNVNISPAEKNRRLVYYHRFHDQVKEHIKELAEAEAAPVILSVHSYPQELFAATPELRDIDCGLLFNRDARLTDVLYAELQTSALNVQKNQPYNLQEYKTGGVIEHGEKNGYPYIGLEFPSSRLIMPDWRAKVAGNIITGLEKFLSS